MLVEEANNMVKAIYIEDEGVKELPHAPKGENLLWSQTVSRGSVVARSTAKQRVACHE
jgi:hypothetical protein